MEGGGARGDIYITMPIDHIPYIAFKYTDRHSLESASDIQFVCQEASTLF